MKGGWMRRPGDEARMAKMRARRAPFTDHREGRLKRQVRRAFLLFGRPLTTTELVKHCYWFVGEEIKSWHRTNVSRVANLLAIPIGRATSQGRPTIWSPRPELMQDWPWVALKHERSTAGLESSRPL
jgi:hypothetical protein